MKITSGSHPGLEMDTTSPAFQHFLGWLAANGAPTPTVVEGAALGFGLKGAEMIVFEQSGKFFTGEALAFYLSPSMSLTELQRELGFGDPMHSVPYPPYVAPVTPPLAVKKFVDKPIAGRPGYWSVTDMWQGKIEFGQQVTAPNGKTVELVDEGGPFNRTGLWKEVA